MKIKYIGIIALLLIVVAFVNLKQKKIKINQIFNFPTNSEVYTTEEKKIVPIDVPTTSPKIKITDISEYSKYGYGKWKLVDGDKRVKRLDLMPDDYNENLITDSKKLVNFFTISDVHITDEESPAQAIYLRDYAKSSSYSGVMMYSTQTLEAAVRTINALHKKEKYNFGISLGDSVNSTQSNELQWYLNVLDGYTVSPYSGVRGSNPPDYQQDFKAEGLNREIPWYQVLGNHDHFWMGFLPADKYIKNTILGKHILALGNPFIDPKAISSRSFYMGAIDGTTQYGNIIGEGSTAVSNKPTVTAADENRRSFSTSEWMNEFLNAYPNPFGHGFTEDSVKNGFANYSFVTTIPNSTIQLKVIVLDDTQRETDPNNPEYLGFGKDSYGYGHGEVTGKIGQNDKRYGWLRDELENGQRNDQLMIVAAHVPIGVVKNPNKMSWQKEDETEILNTLHQYSNVLMWISGHRHIDAITAFKSPKPEQPELGFWEVETASLRDFPQQFRTFDIKINSDNTVSISAINVDPAVSEGSMAEKSRAYAIAASQIYPKDPPTPMPTGTYSGNAELIKQLNPKMKDKIQEMFKNK